MPNSKSAKTANKDTAGKDADIPDTSGDHAAASQEPPKPTPVTHRDKRNKYILHGLQAAGGTGLVVSAILEGNIGRLVTGSANAARNVWQLATLFNTKSRKSERKNEVLMNGVSAGTNIPQLITSASIHETGAAASAVVAYSLRAARYKFSRRMAVYRSKLPPSGHTAINVLIKSTNKLLRFGPSVLLFNRALAQTMDGYVRKDWASFSAGVAFTLGAVFMAASDRKRSVVSKQIKEIKKEKKRERHQEEREVELIKEMDVERQLNSPSEPKVPGQKKKKKPANDDKKGGNIKPAVKKSVGRRPGPPSMF